MTWIMAARIPLSEEERRRLDAPSYVREDSESGKIFREIFRGLYAIVSPYDELEVFDWVEGDLSASVTGVLAPVAPSEELIEQLRAIHPLMGNMELDARHVEMAIAIARDSNNLGSL